MISFYFIVLQLRSKTVERYIVKRSWRNLAYLMLRLLECDIRARTILILTDDIYHSVFDLVP
jgi:hypothetical protein